VRETVGEEEKEKKEGSTRVTVKSERERQNGGGGGRKEGIPRMAHLRWSVTPHTPGRHAGEDWVER
jgi:hypothetical protein